MNFYLKLFLESLLVDFSFFSLLAKSSRLMQRNVSCGPGMMMQEILEGVTDIDLVINLKLREEALIAKCLGRRTCSQCGGNYNVACIDIKAEDGNPRMYMPPLLPPPQCESKLITRSDDTEEVVKERLQVYNELVIILVISSAF